MSRYATDINWSQLQALLRRVTTFCPESDQKGNGWRSKLSPAENDDTVAKESLGTGSDTESDRRAWKLLFRSKTKLKINSSCEGKSRIYFWTRCGQLFVLRSQNQCRMAECIFSIAKSFCSISAPSALPLPQLPCGFVPSCSIFIESSWSSFHFFLWISRWLPVAHG
jgi:hypothetical protein